MIETARLIIRRAFVTGAAGFIGSHLVDRRTIAWLTTNPRVLDRRR
jgi:nucleoside-diphosphate-sugar epimerase